jgi:DNA-3-methyladenine glycosylase II
MSDVVGRRGQLDVAVATRSIIATDPVMAAFIADYGPYAPRSGVGDHFAALARAICYQQLAGRAAAAIHGRVVTALGGQMTAEALLAAPPAELRAAGLSSAKLASLLDLAAKATDGTISLAGIEMLDDEQIIEHLTVVRGIGRWTVEMFLLFELRRPDVWPVDDYGVRHGWSLIYGLPEMITGRRLKDEGERFRPYRSLVALYCWHAVHVARGQVVPGVDRPPLG